MRSALAVPSIVTALVVLLAACATAPAPAPAPEAPTESVLPAAVEAPDSAVETAVTEPSPPALPGLRTREIAPGVWIHVSSQLYAGQPFDSNGLVVFAGDEAFLVDTAWGDAATRELVAWVEEERAARVVGAVVTHGHDDRGGGTAFLRERGIPVWARADTAASLAEASLGVPDQRIGTTGATHLFGGRIEVYYPGPGHTADNIVVYLPRERILFGGCLVRSLDTSTLGNTADAFLGEWASTVERVAAEFPDVEVVVPGHGREAGPETLAHTADLARRGGR